MAESLLVRTEGGPNPGTRVAEGWAWPLPELLLAEGGIYVKASQSSLPPMRGDGHVLRGAQYIWQPGSPTAEQLTEAIAVEIETRRLKDAVALLQILVPIDAGRAAEIYDLLMAVSSIRGSDS